MRYRTCFDAGLHSIRNVANPGVNVVVDSFLLLVVTFSVTWVFANIYCLVEECFSPRLTLAVADWFGPDLKEENIDEIGSLAPFQRLMVPGQGLKNSMASTPEVVSGQRRNRW